MDPDAFCRLQLLHLLRILRRQNLDSHLQLTFYCTSTTSLLRSRITTWYNRCTMVDRTRLQRGVTEDHWLSPPWWTVTPLATSAEHKTSSRTAHTFSLMCLTSGRAETCCLLNLKIPRVCHVFCSRWGHHLLYYFRPFVLTVSPSSMKCTLMSFRLLSHTCNVLYTVCTRMSTLHVKILCSKYVYIWT